VFTGLQPTSSRFRRQRAVGLSIAAHLAVLAAIVFHNPRVIDLSPTWLAYGDGAHTYKLIYFPSGANHDKHPDAAKLLFRARARRTPASRRSPNRPSLRRNLRRCWPARKPPTTIPAPDLLWAP